MNNFTEAEGGYHSRGRSHSGFVCRCPVRQSLVVACYEAVSVTGEAQARSAFRKGFESQ